MRMLTEEDPGLRAIIQAVYRKARVYSDERSKSLAEYVANEVAKRFK